MSTDRRQRRLVAGHRSEEPTSIVIELAVDVAASRHALFTHLANLENNPEWNWAVKSVTSLKAADPAWGVRYSQERVAGGDETHILEITRYEPDEHLEIKGVLDEGHVGYRHHLVRLTSKSTRLRTSVELVPSEPVARPDLYAARLDTAVSANLETLRARFTDRTSVRLTSRSRTT